MARKVQQCIDVIKKAGGKNITHEEAQKLVDDIIRQVEDPRQETLANIEDRIMEIGNTMIGEDRLNGVLQRRNAILTVQAMRKVERFAKSPRFKTLGKGIKAYNEGAPNFRNSVDAQTVSLQKKYVGQLLTEMEEGGVLTEFRTGELDQAVWRELWEINNPEGNFGITGNSRAQTMARAIHKIHQEMIPRENRAGAFIRMNEHFVTRQTHDPVLIRRAGGKGLGEGSQDASRRVWTEFITPLLDVEKTFGGMTDKERVALLKNVHQGLVTKVHGKSKLKVNQEFTQVGSLARKVSEGRVLHFKDADSAYLYNQTFGSKGLRDGVMADIARSSHATSLMENWGPNPQRTFDQVTRGMKEAARDLPDDVVQINSLDQLGVRNSFDSIMGKLDSPASTTMHGITRALLAHSTLSRLGAVTISAIPDKAFLQSTMTYQGMRHMDVFVEQFSLFAPKSPAELRRLRMMGVAVDGFLGDIAMRFTAESNTSGNMYKLQQMLFKINGMNWWNDIHKGAAGKMMSGWLGINHNLSFSKLPDDLSRVLGQYGIDEVDWDIVRKTSYTVGDDAHRFITPDRISGLPDEDVIRLLNKAQLKDTPNNRARMRDELETKFRSYITDQADHAVPTPGSRERRLTFWNTRSGTGVGSAVRLLMHLKGFPITVIEKIIRRELSNYKGRQAGQSVVEWLLSNNKANFRMLNLIAMTMIGGYVSLSVKDALKGRTPRRLVNDDGTINHKLWKTSILRGGGLGIYGDFMFTEYDRAYRTPLQTAAGPIFGTAGDVMMTAYETSQGKDVSRQMERLALSNTPYINLFYIRPVLDYIILWNVQEMLSPGSLSEMELRVEQKNNQGFFLRPSEVVNR